MNQRPHPVSIASAERATPDARVAEPVAFPKQKARRGGGWTLAAGVVILLGGGLGYGAWRDYAQRQLVADTAQQQRDFVPNVLVGEVKASGPTVDATLPGTTFAFEAANIFAR